MVVNCVLSCLCEKLQKSLSAEVIEASEPLTGLFNHKKIYSNHDYRHQVGEFNGERGEMVLMESGGKGGGKY